ncbi:MarR family winged helix-turn-helix transcriptional regulator [Gordonia aichiensis]
MLTNVNDSRLPPRATGAPVLTADQLALWQSFVDGGWALMAQVNSTFGAHGWTTTDLRLLEVLGTREQFGISELASTVHMGVSTVSRQIGRMIDTGDVVRVRSDLDGRHRLVRITDAGRDTLERITAVRDRVIREYVIDVLGEDDFTTICLAMRKVRTSWA